MTEKGSSATRRVSKPYNVYMRPSNQAPLVVQMFSAQPIFKGKSPGDEVGTLVIFRDPAQPETFSTRSSYSVIKRE